MPSNRSWCRILLDHGIVLGVAAILGVVVAQLPEGRGARAQPASDGFAVTATVALPFTNVQSTADVTTEVGEPSPCGGTVRSKVHCTTTTGAATLTPPFSGRLVLPYGYPTKAYANANDHPELDVTGSLTVEAWVKYVGDYSWVQSIAYKFNAYILSLGYSDNARCVGFVLWSASGPVGGDHCRWPPPFYPGWHHVAGVFSADTGEMRTYLDGSLYTGPSPFTGTINNSGDILQVGYNLVGEIDELRISDAARYTGSTYSVPTSPFTCDEQTRALWHFDELDGATEFHDACGAVDNLLVGYNGAHTERVAGVDTIGIYVPSIGMWFLRNANSSGMADLTFSYGAGISDGVAATGDWDGDGTDTIGIYRPSDGMWFLRNDNSGGVADLTFSYGAGISGGVAVVGDWNGDGTDTIGIYRASDGMWFLRNDNSSGVADLTFSYGAGISGGVAVVGDWDGDADDTIGIYDPSAGLWFLRNDNSGGVADLTFSYGAGISGGVAVVGDWNDDGTDTIGIYRASDGMWFLRNANTNGVANLTFSYGAGISGGVAAVGDWDGL